MSHDHADRLEALYRRYVQTGEAAELTDSATKSLAMSMLEDGIGLEDLYLVAMVLWSRAEHINGADEERELASSLFSAIYQEEADMLAPEIRAAFDAREAQDEHGRDPSRPQDDPGYQAAVASLAKAEAMQDLAATGEVARWFEARIGYATEDSALLPYLFMHLGYAKHMLARATADPQPVEEAIGYLQQAADGFPNGHPEGAHALSLLGNAHRLRFERTGDPDAIDAAVHCTEAAISASGDDATMWQRHMNACMARRTRFGMGQDLADLRAAAQHARASLAGVPPDSVGRLIAQANAANALAALHSVEPADSSLDEVIDLGRDVVRGLPRSHPRWAPILADLAVHLAERYEEEGRKEDAAEALQASQMALDSLPDGHPERGRLMMQRQSVIQLTGTAASWSSGCLPADGDH